MNPENASNIKYDLIEAAGQKVLFTPLRIDRDSVPKGLYCYDLRHGDDDSIACTIEKFVFVNHFGTILCSKPFDLGNQHYLELEDSIDFLSLPETTLQEFQEKGALRLVVEYGMESASKEFACVDMNADSGDSIRLYIANTLECEDDLRCYPEVNEFLSKLPAGNDVAVHIHTYMFGSGIGEYANEDEMEYVRAHFDEMEAAMEVSCTDKCQFEISNVNNKEIQVLIVEPGKSPRTAAIPNNLDSLQAVVGGMIEMIDLDEKTCLVCNEEGKLLGLPGNRKVGDDIIAGTFFLCGMNEDGNTISLTDKQLGYYSWKFNRSERYSDEQVQDALYFKIESYDNTEEFLNHLFGGDDEEDEEDLEP